MASPPPQFLMDFGNSSSACYDQRNIVVSKIGEWILRNSSSNTFAYTYYNMGNSMGEDPNSIVYGFLPHLLLMLVLVAGLSHSLHLFLSRLKQPLIISQIIVVSLMFLPWKNDGTGDNSDNDLLFLPQKRRLEIAIGLMAVTFKMFVYAAKTDISMMWRIGKKPIIIGLASLIIPLITALIVSCILYNNIRSFVEHKEKFVIFFVALFSHSAFIVLSDILSEFGLLSSELGRLTLSSSMVQTSTGLVFIGVFGIVDQGQHGGTKLILISVSMLLFLAAFIIFIVRPYGMRIVQDTGASGFVRESHIFYITLIMIMMALLSDIAGAIFILGPIMMGFVLPYGSPLGKALVERVELMGSEVLMPLFYITVGRNMDWAAASLQWRLWISLDLIILTISIAKFATVVLAAYYCDMSLQNGLLLGLIMNFKGFLEILVFMHFFYGQVLDRATLTMMMSSIFITVLCAPLVSIIYKPLDFENDMISIHTVQDVDNHNEIRVLSYLFDEKPVPCLLDFLECLTSQETKSCTSIYPLHLINLNAGVASSLIDHRNKNGQVNLKEMELAHKHFISFGQEKQKNVTVFPFTFIAPQHNMHQDICAFILEKKIALVIAPFPRKNSIASLDTQYNIWSLVPKVLEQARSSVGIMVYHGNSQIALASHSAWQYHIGVVFFGGPDDREALAIASRMANHPNVHINLLWFRTCDMNKNQKKKIADSLVIEEALDRQILDGIQKENINNNQFGVTEVTGGDVETIIFTLRSFGDKYDLMIVGRRRGQSSLMISRALEEWIESPELGVLGDLLATWKYEKPANILVVQKPNSH